MINLLLIAGRMALEFAFPTEAIATRTAVSLARRGTILERASARRIFRRGRQGMGILDASLANIRRGVTAFAEPTESPTRILPPLTPTPGEQPLTPFPSPERIPVPPNAYPYNPIQGNSYFQSARFTQNIYNSNYQTSPGPNPPVQKEPSPDPKLNNLVKADILSNLMSSTQSMADSWLPHMAWEGHVQATGFKTTPTRTVVHYALAVAFGLINQQRLSSIALGVDVDYETNHVTVSYVSKAYWLTEVLTIGVYALSGTFPPSLVPDAISINKKATDAFSRSLGMGFRKGITAGAIELGKEGAQLAGDALKLILKAYQNMGRMLGPLGVYDMGADTLYGGRASALLRAPIQPEPFASMQNDKNGNPVPLLTRLPAPNPQPPVATGTDPASGYSLDLRSLVAQALYDPGILPPTPDTNVSLTPVI